MFKICQNFRSAWNVTYCRITVNCEFMGLNFAESHSSPFSKLRFSENVLKCKLYTIGSSQISHKLCQDALTMPKRKRSTFQSNDGEKVHKKKQKIGVDTKSSHHKHKKSKSHSKKKKKEKRDRHLRRKSDSNVDGKSPRNIKISRRKNGKCSLPEIIDIASSEDSSDIIIIYDSKAKSTRSGPVADTNSKNANKQNTPDKLKCKPYAFPIVNIDNLEVVEKDLIPSHSEPSISVNAVCQSKLKTVIDSKEKHINIQQSTEYISSSIASPDRNSKEDIKWIPLPANSPQHNSETFNQCDSTSAPKHSVEQLHETDCLKDKSKSATYSSKRSWQYTTEFMTNAASGDNCMRTEEQLIFNVLCYNVLSQSILEAHPYLYSNHNPVALSWESRSKLLLQELKSFQAEILCLQEVQQSHLSSFFNNLQDIGYSGIYKQRTGNNVDGVAIYYKKDTFNLTDYTTVEYFQPGVDVLNRDNVALVAKFAPKIKPSERVVVATTHLLFNPRRHDVKLAQIQLLLAEVDRFAFKGFDSSTGEAMYWPVIITGDMNFEPHTGAYELLTKGKFQYEERCRKTLSLSRGSYTLNRRLIPQYLEITDGCQHWGLLQHRPHRSWDHMAEIRLLKIYNGDHIKQMSQSKPPQGMHSLSVPEKPKNLTEMFETGILSHQFHLKSVYNQDPHGANKTQVTTFQNGWVVVDYIFYSNTWDTHLKKVVEGKLKLKARYKLFNEQEAKQIGPIPNLTFASDHYALCAKFALLL